MFETVKALPGLIKDWKSNSDLIYQLVGCLAGVLAIAACAREQRPSDVLAATMDAIGAFWVARWFESGLPSFLAKPHAEASRALVFFAALAVLIMLVKPFTASKPDDWSIDLEARGLLGSRAAVTMWVLLMFAAQLGSLAVVAEWLRSRKQAAVIVATVIALIIGLAYAAARRFKPDRPLNAAGTRLVKFGSNLGVVAMVTGVALTFVLIGPILGVATWLFAADSDAYADVKRQVARKLARSQQPTGAVLRTSQPVE